MSFSALKNRRKNSLENLQATIDDMEKSNGGNKQNDDRFWYPERDSAGNGSGTIRFLPESDGESLAFQRLFSHGFETENGWYIENCPTTLGPDHKCPVCEENRRLWKTGIEENKKIAQDRKRDLRFFSNILVVSDPKNPENEGQVKILKYGRSVFDILKDASKVDPDFPDDPVFDPWDPWTGANLRFKVRKHKGRANYEKSEFENPEPLGTDKEIDKIWQQQHPLKPFVDESLFKPYEDLKARFDKVVHGKSAATATANDIPVEEEEFELEESSGSDEVDLDNLIEEAEAEATVSVDDNETGDDSAAVDEFDDLLNNL